MLDLLRPSRAASWMAYLFSASGAAIVLSASRFDQRVCEERKGEAACSGRGADVVCKQCLPARLKVVHHSLAAWLRAKQLFSPQPAYVVVGTDKAGPIQEHHLRVYKFTINFLT